MAYMAQDRNKKKSFSVLYDDEQRPLHTLQIYTSGGTRVYINIYVYISTLSFPPPRHLPAETPNKEPHPSPTRTGDSAPNSNAVKQENIKKMFKSYKNV